MASRVWGVFAVYLLAFAGVVVCSLMAAVALKAAYPDVPDQELFDSLPGLLAGGLASSAALGLTVVSVTRPLGAQALRLQPGRETGRDLLAAVAGTLALGQALDSLTMLAGLGQHGSMAVIRRALEGAGGPDLFAAVVVIGVLAGGAEEVFFRGWMQTRLREHWPASRAVVVTSVAFGLMHLEWLHAALAVALSLWLGFVTEQTGSALPAVAAHVINNSVFTLLTAAAGSVTGFESNAALLAASTAVFLACLRRLQALGRPA
ncbi:MAG TPA: CPBP family intramembrane glutamic endopeptidase [Candidatus Binatia bacterium]|nr:CPBP family intramembrane glutamic endopeptidase [Candidatus Binatia bacterium]